MCNTHVCAHSSKWSANPQLTSSATQVCVFAHKQSVCKSLESVKASFDLFCTRHVCVQKQTHVYAHNSNWSASPRPGVLSSTDFVCSTHVCVLTAVFGLPKLLIVQNLHMTSSLDQLTCSARDMCVFRNTHTCVCPQQQLVGQPLSRGCNPQLTSSATHNTRVCVCAHGSSWSAKGMFRAVT